MKEYRFTVDHFIYSSSEEYEEARKEYEAVQYLRENLSRGDEKSAYQVYRKLNEKPSFHSVVGLNFMNELHQKITSSGNELLQEIEPVKIERMKQLHATNTMQNVSLKQDRVTPNDSLLQKNKRQRIVIGFLILILMGMILMAGTKKATVMRTEADYENELTDRYAAWEEELSMREKAVMEAEKKWKLNQGK